jgi:universal stress protein E
MQRFENILCVVSPDEACKQVVEQAVALAEANQAELTVVSVVPAPEWGRLAADTPRSVDELQSAYAALHRKQLDEFLQPWAGRSVIRSTVLEGKVFLEVIRAVLRDRFDLVLKLAGKSGLLQRVFGSDDMHLLRKCPCPVWLLRPAESQMHPQRIVAAIDIDVDSSDSANTALNDQILSLASSISVESMVELHLVHAWDAPGELAVLTWSNNPVADTALLVERERRLHQAGMDRLRDQLGHSLGAEAYDLVAPTFHLVKGAASAVIPETARSLGADLVVMGTLARTGVPGLLIGNTAETILEQLDCSVLAVKPPGFVTPVTLVF